MHEHHKFLLKMEEVESILQPLWFGGRRKDALEGSGPHWTIPGSARPVSIDQLEGRLLFNLIVVCRASCALEIGTGFGYSTAWIAGALNYIGGSNTLLVTIDSLTEGLSGPRNAETARYIADVLGLQRIIAFYTGRSAALLPNAMQGRTIDLAFIDGNHNAHQPLKDFKLFEAVLAPDALVVWHDHDDRYSVPSDVETVCAEGYIRHIVPTSCQMAITYRNDELTDKIQYATSEAIKGRLVS